MQPKKIDKNGSDHLRQFAASLDSTVSMLLKEHTNLEHKQKLRKMLVSTFSRPAFNSGATSTGQNKFLGCLGITAEWNGSDAKEICALLEIFDFFTFLFTSPDIYKPKLKKVT